jgi:hypothetical protein
MRVLRFTNDFSAVPGDGQTSGWSYDQCHIDNPPHPAEKVLLHRGHVLKEEGEAIAMLSSMMSRAIKGKSS